MRNQVGQKWPSWAKVTKLGKSDQAGQKWPSWAKMTKLGKNDQVVQAPDWLKASKGRE